jgi:hypothetical protein
MSLMNILKRKFLGIKSPEQTEPAKNAESVEKKAS